MRLRNVTSKTVFLRLQKLVSTKSNFQSTITAVKLFLCFFCTLPWICPRLELRQGNKFKSWGQGNCGHPELFGSVLGDTSRRFCAGCQSKAIRKEQGTYALGGFKKALGGVFCRSTRNPIRVPFLGDSVRILGVCPAATPTFGL